jgi:hypothetical protein
LLEERTRIEQEKHTLLNDMSKYFLLANDFSSERLIDKTVFVELAQKALVDQVL